MTDAPYLTQLVAEARAAPDTLGLLLHGSRAVGSHRDDSDYDLIRIVTDTAYIARQDRSALVERVRGRGGQTADVFYQSLSRIEQYVRSPDWYTATYLAARVLFDRTGNIVGLLSRMKVDASRVAHEQTTTAYDDYLNCFVRSIKAARRGDELGRRLHAAASAQALIKTLFGLEREWPPYHDQLAAALPRIEEAQGWPRGFLSEALLRLVDGGDPTFQQELEARVETLMSARGVQHEWGDDLTPLKAHAF